MMGQLFCRAACRWNDKDIHIAVAVAGKGYPFAIRRKSRIGVSRLVNRDPTDILAVIIGSPNVNPGYKLVGNTTYPQITQDYEKGFRVLKSLPCDLFLGAHGSYFDMETKYERFKGGQKTAFVDPGGYKEYVAEREQAFQRELRKQQGTSK